ncbi:MAG: META domain-containing protein, partial [Caldilineaceae bacterium]
MFRKPSLIALLLVCAALLLVACGSDPTPTPSPQEAVATAESAIAETAADHALSSTAWQLDNIGSPDDPVALLPDTTATVTYFWDRYAGYDGCNWFLGVYQADADGNLRMQTPARSLDVCEPVELQQQAATVVSALLNVVSYTMQGEQLIENTSDNQPLLTFSPAAPVPVPGTTWDLKFWWDNDIALWTPLIPESTVNIL